MFTDSAWGAKGAGASTVLISPTGARSKYVARLKFKVTNNVAEYEGVILGLTKAKAMEIQRILVKTDSMVVPGQVEKEYMAREPELSRYLESVRALEKKFKGFTLKHIPRGENQEADELAKVAAKNQELPQGAFYEEKDAPATSNKAEAIKEILSLAKEDWREEIVNELKAEHVHSSKDKAARIA